MSCSPAGGVPASSNLSSPSTRAATATGRYPAQLMCPDAPLPFERANSQGLPLHNAYGMNYTQLPGMSLENAPAYWNAFRRNDVRSPAAKIFFTDATSEHVYVSDGYNGSRAVLQLSAKLW